MILCLVCGLKSGFMITKASLCKKSCWYVNSPSKLLFVELPVKFPLCFLTVAVLHSKFNELWQAGTCLFKWILWKCNTSFLTPVCISIQTQQKGSAILMMSMRNNISNLLLLIDVGQASCLYLLCHLFIQLIIHSPSYIGYLCYTRPCR